MAADLPVAATTSYPVAQVQLTGTRSGPPAPPMDDVALTPCATEVSTRSEKPARHIRSESGRLSLLCTGAPVVRPQNTPPTQGASTPCSSRVSEETSVFVARPALRPEDGTRRFGQTQRTSGRCRDRRRTRRFCLPFRDSSSTSCAPHQTPNHHAPQSAPRRLPGCWSSLPLARRRMSPPLQSAVQRAETARAPS